MQCLLFAISDEAAFARMTTEEQQQLFAAFGEYGKALNEAGVPSETIAHNPWHVRKPST